MGLDLFRGTWEEKYGKALSYYEYARDNDLYLTYAIISPQADRSKGPGEQADEFVAAGVVDEDETGITIKGAKMLATGCPMANEVMVASIQPLKPGDEKYSFTAMVPLGDKRVEAAVAQIVCEGSRQYRSSIIRCRLRSIENDSVLSTYSMKSKCPGERVFVHNDVRMAAAQWHSTPTHCYQNYQCQIRLMVKMRFLLGLARKITETNGVIGFPPVRETLGQMAAEVSMVEGLVESMEISGSQYGSYFVPNSQRHGSYAAMVLTQQLYPEVCAFRKASRVGWWRNDYAARRLPRTFPTLGDRGLHRKDPAFSSNRC